MVYIERWLKPPKFLIGAGCLLIILAALLLVVKPASAATGINEQISFQGKVVNTDGTNITNGDYSFLFCFYTVASPTTACTTGANNDAVWRESKTLTVTNGVFQTNLGDTTTLPGSVDFNSDNIYLGVNFNSDGQMTPLIRMTAVPQAFNSDLWDGLDAAALTQTEVNVLDGGVDESEVTGVITAVTASTGLSGGGASGSVSLSVADDGLNFAQLSDSLSLDATTSVSFGGASNYGLTLTNDGTSDLIVNLTSTGDFVIKDNSVDLINIADNGGITIAGGSAFVLDTASGSTIRFGSSSDNLTLAATTREPGLNGAARHTRRIALTAEYPGASMTGDGSSNTGTMTSDNMTSTPYRNFYKWLNTQGTAQDYDIWVRIPLPADFSAMPTSQTICLDTYASATTANTITLTLYDTSNTAVTITDSDLTPSSTTTWQSQCTSSITGGTYAANGYITLDFKLTAPATTGDVRIADLYFDYLSKW